MANGSDDKKKRKDKNEEVPESQEGGSETGPQKGEPTPADKEVDEEIPLDPETNPSLFQQLGLDLTQFNPDLDQDENVTSQPSIFNQSPPKGSVDSDDSGEDQRPTIGMPDPTATANPPEKEAAVSASTMPTELDHPIKRATDLTFQKVSEGEMVEMEDPIRPNYTDDDPDPVRQWFDTNEPLDQTDFLDMFTQEKLQDMSDEEVVSMVAEKKPKLVEKGVIEPEEQSPQEAYDSLNDYYRRRLEQRKRKENSGTMFSEMRSVLKATKGQELNVNELSDEEILVNYSKVAYKGQKAPPMADAVDDLIASSKEKYDKIFGEKKNVHIAENPEDLSTLANQMEEHYEEARKQGRRPNFLVSFEDPDTGEKLTFAHPEQIDQYQRKMRWRNLNYKNRSDVMEWFTGAAMRDPVTLADLGAELAQYGMRINEQLQEATGLELDNSSLSPVSNDTAIEGIERFQKNLNAMRRHGGISRGDDIKQKKVFDENAEDGWLPQGEALYDPTWWSANVGEIFGLSLPGIVAYHKSAKLADDLLAGTKFWGRARELRNLKAAGKLTDDGRKVTASMIRKAERLEGAARTGIAATMYEMPLESAEAMKSLYEQNENPTVGQQAAALGSGLVSGWIGAYGDREMYKLLTGNYKKVAGEALEEASDEKIKALTTEVLHRFGKKAKQFAGSMPIEVTTETTQEAVKDVTSLWTTNEYESYSEFWKDNKEKYAQTAAGALGLSLFMGGAGMTVGGGIGNTVARAKQSQINKMLRAEDSDQLREFLGENSTMARLYENDRGNVNLAVSGRALNDPEFVQQIEEYFRQQTEKDVASSLGIDIMGPDQEKMETVSGVEELYQRMHELHRKYNGLSPDNAGEADGQMIAPRIIEQIEDAGTEPDTSPVSGRRSAYKTPLAEQGEGQGVTFVSNENQNAADQDGVQATSTPKASAEQASENEKYVGALVEKDGETFMISEITGQPDAENPTYSAEPVDQTEGTSRTVQFNGEDISDSDVIAWRDRTQEIGQRSEQEMRRQQEANLEAAHPDNTQPYDDAEVLINEAEENGDISTEEAEALQDRVDEYRSLQQSLGSSRGSIQRTALQRREEVLAKLDEDLSALLSLREGDSVDHDFQADPTPTDESDIPNEARTDEANTSDEANTEARLDQFQQQQREQFAKQLDEMQKDEDVDNAAQELQDPKNQTWYNEEAGHGAVVYDEEGNRGEVQDTANQGGWFTIEMENGDVRTTQKGRGEFNKVHPDDMTQIEDMSSESERADSRTEPVSEEEFQNVRGDELPTPVSESLHGRKVVYRSQIEGDGQARVIEIMDPAFEEESRSPDDDVVVLDENGNAVDEVDPTTLEEKGVDTAGTLVIPRSDEPVNSSEANQDANEAVARALDNGDDVDLTTPEGVEEAIDDELNVEEDDVGTFVETVFAERQDGKRVFKSTPESDDATPYYKISPPNSDVEFVAPKPTGTGQFEGTEALSDFSETTHNESGLDPANGVPFELYDTAIDASGHRVGRHYGRSADHAMDEQAGQERDPKVANTNIREASPVELRDLYQKQAEKQNEAENTLADARAEDGDTEQAINEAERQRDRAIENQDKIRRELESRELGSIEDEQSYLSGDQTINSRATRKEVKYSKKRRAAQQTPNADGNTGSPVGVVREVVNQFRRAFSNIPSLKVVTSPADLPLRIKKEAGNSLGRVEGVYDRVGGQIFLVSDNLNTKRQAVRTVLHEAAGHVGLRNIIPASDFAPLMQEVFRALEGKVLEGDGQFRSAGANERSQTLLRTVARNQGFDLTTDQGKELAAEEALARIAERTPQPSFLDQLWAKITAAFRKAIRPLANRLGVDPMSFTDSEIRWIVANARNSLSGTPETSVTIGAQGIEQVPWQDMNFRVSGPSYYSRMVNTLLNPTEKTRQKLRNGKAIDPGLMKNLLSKVQNGQFKADEMDAIELNQWLDQQAEEGNQVSVEDVQEYIEEHQIHIAEVTQEDIQAEIQQAERERQRAIEARDRAEEERNDAYRDLEFSSQEAAENLRETAQNLFDDPARAEQLAIQFQRVVDQALNRPDDNPLSDLQESLEQQGAEDEILQIIGEISRKVDNFAEAKDRLQEAESRVADAEEKVDFLESQEERSQGVPFSQDKYNLPGGQNQKNLLLQLPQNVIQRATQKRIDDRKAEVSGLKDQLQDLFLAVEDARTRGAEDRVQSIQENIADVQEQIQSLESEIRQLENQQEDEAFVGQHFNEPNVLAHIRMNERQVGPFNVLFIEEIQSDWVQEGRDKGFADETVADAQARIREINNEIQSLQAEKVDASQETRNQIDQEIESLLQERQDVREALDQGIDKVADLPDVLKDSWYNLAAKRVMLHAAENGFDTVAWATGDQQADRYHLADRFQDIEYEPGTLNVTMSDGDSRSIPLQEGGATGQGDSPSSLEEIVGETLAGELRAEYEQTGEPVVRDTREGLDNVDRRQGMRQFYDETLLNVFSNFAESYSGQAAPASAEEFAVGPNGEFDVHAATVSDKMKSQLPENGVPLFRQSEQQIHSEQFKRWFGDWAENPSEASKAVDPETGEPLVLYHGTKSVVNRPSAEEANMGVVTDGFNLTESSEIASDFAEKFANRPPEARGRTGGPNVMPLYLKAENPLDLDNNSLSESQAQEIVQGIIDQISNERAATFFRQGALGVLNRSSFRQGVGYSFMSGLTEQLRQLDADQSIDFSDDSVSIARVLQDLGFDSVVHDSNDSLGGQTSTVVESTPTSRTWVAFESNQFKSATGNEGSFSDDTGDIRFSKTRSDEGAAEDGQRYTAETPEAEDAMNPQTIVGYIKQMLSQMLVPGTGGQHRIKEFAMERGHRNLVDPDTGLIKFESYDDLRSIAEMTGEFLYYEFRDGMNELGIDVRSAYSELDKVASNMENVDEDMDADTRRAKAMAKLIGEYMEGGEIGGVAGNFKEAFEKFADKFELQDNFHHIRDLFKAYNSKHPVDGIEGMMAGLHERGWLSKKIYSPSEWMKGLRGAREKVYELLYDQYYPVYKMMRDMNQGEMPKDIENNTYLMARMQHGADGVAENFLTNGVRTLDGEQLSEPLRDAFTEVAQSQEMWKDFNRYLVLKRAQELEQQMEDGERGESFDIPEQFKDGKAQKYIDMLFESEDNVIVFDGHENKSGRGYDRETFEEASRKVQEYNDALLDYAVDEGYLARDEAEKMKDMGRNYIPWNRLFDEQQAEAHGSTSDGLEFMEGNSDLVIDHPIKNLIRNTFSLVRAVHTNRVFKSVWNNLPDEGERNQVSAAYARRVPRPQSQIGLTANKIAEGLARNGVDDGTIDRVKEQVTDDNGDLINFFIPTKPRNTPDDVVKVMVDGEAKFMKFEEELADVILNDDTYAQNWASNFVKRGNQIFRNLTTAQNPIFGMKELARDTGVRAIQTTAEGNQTGSDVADTVIGMADAGINIGLRMLVQNEGAVQDLFDDFKNSGAYLATKSMVQQNVQKARTEKMRREAARNEGGVLSDVFGLLRQHLNQQEENLDASTRMKRAYQKLWDNFRDTPEKIKNFNNALENLNRMREYKVVKRNEMEKERQRHREETGERLDDNPEAKRKAKRKANLTAGFQARNVTIDFAKKGRWGKHINQYVPFFNSRFQAWDRFKQTVANNKKHAAKMIGVTAVIPAIANAFMVAGNPWYEEQSEYRKDMYFLIPKPGSEGKNGWATEFIEFPKIHMYAPMAGSAVQRFTIHAIDEGMLKDKSLTQATASFADRVRRGQETGYLKSVLGNTLPVDLSPAIGGSNFGSSLANSMGPRPLMPIMESIMNYSTFTESQIRPQSEQKVEAYLSYGPNTSLTSRKISKAANEMGWDVSPRILDHVTNGAFGTGGQFIRDNMMDPALSFTAGEKSDYMASIQDKAREELDSGEKELSGDVQLPIAGRMPGDKRRESSWLSDKIVGMIRPVTKEFVAESGSGGAQSVATAYSYLNRARKASNNVDEKMKRGESKESIREYVKNNYLAVALGRSTESDIRGQLRQLETTEQEIVNASFDQISGTEKMEYIQKIWLGKVQTARKFNAEVNILKEALYDGISEEQAKKMRQDAGISGMPGSEVTMNTTYETLQTPEDVADQVVSGYNP